MSTSTKRDFLDIVDEHIQADNSTFDEAMGTGFLLFYDRKEPRPEMTSAALYAYFSAESDDPQWIAGLAAGWCMAMLEDNPDFYWTSCEPPTR